ncbi:MAG TPA: hypothetical protein VL362_02390 [Patescibacteria group bacterium]|jgi:hypothetical protein|nr:hypothetical protein [Patescibacteria group bacterium]
MLTLKKRRHIHFPSIALGAHQLQMSPILSEDDELIEAIDNQTDANDDNWSLEPVPDTIELTKYWQTVEHDIAKDPEWITFSDD